MGAKYERHPKILRQGEAVCPLCYGVFDERLHPHDLCPHCYDDLIGPLDQFRAENSDAEEED